MPDHEVEPEELLNPPEKSIDKKKIIFISFVSVIVFAFLATLVMFFVRPITFRTPIDQKMGGVVVEITSGMSAGEISTKLKDMGIIRSKTAFDILVKLGGDSRRIVVGNYLFTSPVSVIDAESRIINGRFGIKTMKVTFPEGFTLKQVEERLKANLPNFDITKFHALASTSEGYLFPETYFFTASDDEAVVYQKMREVFDSKTKNLMNGRNVRDIITMASILEKEVKHKEDMQIVAGILWKRIKIGMALQVDATLAYERGLTSAELSHDDLTLDTPYNTYTNRGLPPTPINNPGLNAIEATLNPTATGYLYFITDKDGNAHYAKSFEEHKRNVVKYLN